MTEQATISPAVPTIAPAAETRNAPWEQAAQPELLFTAGPGLPIQRKLSIGAVDDPLEHEADAMADRVMRMPEPKFVQKKCAHCADEEKAQRKPLVSFIQKKESANNDSANDDAARQIQSTRGAGSSIPDSTRSFMESRFGADFSNVQIHSGSYASQLSNQLNAQAFTVGNDIYFNEGKFSPESGAGRHLLAHELTHTIQQGASRSTNSSIQPKPAFIQRKEDAKPITESKEITKEDKKIKVERIITPTKCKVNKHSSSSLSGDFKNSKLLFEAKACKNNWTGEAYGDLDFKDFVDGAEKFIKAAPSSLSSGGNISDSLAKEIDKDFKDANLKASLRLVFKIGRVRVETKGTGSASLNKTYEAGVDGFIRYANGKFNIELGGGFQKTWSQVKDTDEATIHLYTDAGPIIIRVDAKYTGTGTTIEGKIRDADISKNHGIGVTYTDENGEKKVVFSFSFTLPEKIPTEKAPDCVFCVCEPDIKYLCSDITPEKPGTPNTKVFERKYIPLFYNYATADPRNDSEVPASEYDRTISTIIRAIEDGYTIDHIEGYTSPEGPLDHKRGKFEGNEQLSSARAENAAVKIKLAIAKKLELSVYSLSIKGNNKVKANLTAANNKGISIVGRKEMYGADKASNDIAEKKLFDHLSKELKAPATDEQDILEKDRVKGQTLPEELRDLAETDVTSFRTGVEHDKKLSKDQRLQKLYPWLRRALVIMDPPPVVIDITDLPSSVKKEIIGTAIPCTDEHKKLFEDTPLPSNEKIFIDNCSSKKQEK